MNAFFRNLLPIFALAILSACAGDSPTAPTPVAQTPKYTVTAFAVDGSDLVLVPGQTRTFSVALELEGAPASDIPLSGFNIETATPGVVSISTTTLSRDDGFRQDNGKPRTIIHQFLQLTGLKAGTTQIGITHALATGLKAAADASVYLPALATITADPAIVEWGKSSVIRYSCLNGTETRGYNGVNGWEGDKQPTGTFNTGALFGTVQFNLSCHNRAGTSEAVVVVTTTPPKP